MYTYVFLECLVLGFSFLINNSGLPWFSPLITVLLMSHKEKTTLKASLQEICQGF